MQFTSHYYAVNGQNLHVKIGGNESGPVMLMLHGFPEYWTAWAGVAEHMAKDYRLILPDQRGFNLSSKPTDQGAYHTKNLVADMVALMDEISPTKPFVLCGHDWGASVAYALAMRNGDRVSHLIIANGVHPICFQKALYAGGPQTDASQYMNVLSAKGSETHLCANNFEKLLDMFEKFSAAPWLSGEIRKNYVEAWSHKGALSAMLNWYRESPMVVPKSGTPAQEMPITDEMCAKFYVPMPHLLLWGQQDPALLPEARGDLDKFCGELTVKETADASHWILHEKPDWAAGQMNKFLHT